MAKIQEFYNFEDYIYGNGEEKTLTMKYDKYVRHTCIEKAIKEFK